MVKQQLESDLKKAVLDLGYKIDDIVCDIPQNSSFGDYTSNIALQLSKLKSENGKQTPQVIAKEIIEKLGKLDYLDKTEVAGPGFINFFIKGESLAKQVSEILEKGEGFGKGGKKDNKIIDVEFISANPTGPLTLANGRGGAIGDTLANVLSFLGYQVHREYYVNDTGNQVRLLGEATLAAAGKVESKEEHYKGEYIKDLAKKFSDKLDLDPQQLGHLLADHLLDNEIKPAISRLGISFDEYYSERSVYERGLIEKTADILKKKGVAYEKDGALWFKSTEFGDEKDRALITSIQGGRGKEEPTYFMADIAHHEEVLSRGYFKKINILGADHFGYADRIKGAADALGFKGKVDIIFMQFVRLFKGGTEVRMSKRAGTFVTLDELLEQVSKDVARFFFLMYSPDTHIDFNLDLAKEQSNKNPVFYVQYAHVRMANILTKAETKFDKPNLDLLTTTAELELIKYLTGFPELILEIGDSYSVHKLTTYSARLADLFHKFYESCRVLNAETEDLKVARLALVKACKIVLGNSLNIMGIEAPERM
ncbi:MAG: arginine--tRNA ligase [Microgenomates group bacterium]|jgi:arginyl-tRNA synthetase